MFRKIVKLITAMMLVLLAFNSGFAQSKSIMRNEEQKVRELITDFNKILFNEDHLIKAFKKHYYLEEPDEIDLRAEVDADFAEITRESAEKDKVRHFALQFYFENWIQLLHWKLGTDTVSDNTKFVDFEIAKDKSLINIWAATLKENGITEEALDRIGNVRDKENLNFYECQYEMWRLALAKNIDKNLLDKNLRFIDSQTNIKEVVVEDRKYFTIKNKLFSYTVAFKNGTPKIMRINRN